ncbi:MAG: sigma-70 family RNA polymerase sigma factor [Clostridiales bacterium]|nr:sigma-70 family RNA polymerase sigma factor [Clostridiales bacterium]MCF8023845.1 sigma-70 family RNA polymerase sigma factor [Clostridiales bacterium]
MEAEIISGLKKGKEEAVALLVDKYGDRMLRAASAITGDQQIAEEVVQDTFLQVCKKIDSFNNESSLQTWIYRITINTAKNYIRGAWFRKVSNVENDEIASFSGPHADNPEDKYIQKEEGSGVILSLKKLPRKYREVLVLYYLEELSIKEISNILKQPEGSIKSKLSRGRTMLKAEIGKKRGIESG